MPAHSRPTVFLQTQPQTNGPGNCPDCNAPMVAQSGCVSCLRCGWSRCG